MKKCIVISDSFKGSLPSRDICAIARERIPLFFPACEVSALNVADGGEGTVDCFLICHYKLERIGSAYRKRRRNKHYDHEKQ